MKNEYVFTPKRWVLVEQEIRPARYYNHGLCFNKRHRLDFI
jgi:hypothetical protein